MVERWEHPRFGREGWFAINLRDGKTWRSSDDHQYWNDLQGELDENSAPPPFGHHALFLPDAVRVSAAHDFLWHESHHQETWTGSWERPVTGDTIGLLVNLGCSECKERCRWCEQGQRDDSGEDGCVECRERSKSDRVRGNAGTAAKMFPRGDAVNLRQMTCACAGASSFGAMTAFRNGEKLGVAFRAPVRPPTP